MIAREVLTLSYGRYESPKHHKKQITTWLDKFPKARGHRGEKGALGVSTRGSGMGELA